MSKAYKSNNKEKVKKITVQKISSDYLIKNELKGNILKIIILIAIMPIIIFPSFFRGMYFEIEQLICETYILAVFVLFWIYKLIKRDRAFIKTPLEFGAFSLFILYLFSIIYAVGTRQAFL